MSQFEVRLSGVPVGGIVHEGERSEFFFYEDYLNLDARPVLGLRFEDNLRGRFVSSVSLPTWFSNLLPEGILRSWIADEAGVSPAREMELLARVGHDLPGAVEVLEVQRSYKLPVVGPADLQEDDDTARATEESELRFSLAGVALKFSMVRSGRGLALPAYGRGGDWIVKTPDASFKNVPANEFVMMRWAAAAGLEVPIVDLVDRDELSGLPENVWPNEESKAYAVQRFDRAVGSRAKIHIEDFCQVRGWSPLRKYHGTYETLAALIWRQHDDSSLREFVRRLVFNAAVGNSDAHLKNWSLRYEDAGRPRLAPAYDLLATSFYSDSMNFKRMALKCNGSRDFHSLRFETFNRLGSRIGYPNGDLGDVAQETLRSMKDSRDIVTANTSLLGEGLAHEIGLIFDARSATLKGSLDKG